MSSSKSSKEYMLIAGAVLGALLAASGLLEPSAPEQKQVVAQVNGDSISKSEYLDFLDLIARDKRNPMSATDRRQVLDRLIEERLLLERALEIGIAREDPKVRKTIINAMIQSAAAEADLSEPDELTLRQFFEENLAYFSKPPLLAVRRMVFRGQETAERAASAHEKLPDLGWVEVENQFADRDILSMPTSPLPLSKLRSYLGPTTAELLLSMQSGQYTTPIQEQAGHSIVQLIETQPSITLPFDQLKEQVTREYQRRQRDSAVRDYLEDLRDLADVVIDEQFLDQLSDLQVH